MIGQSYNVPVMRLAKRCKMTSIVYYYFQMKQTIQLVILWPQILDNIDFGLNAYSILWHNWPRFSY